MSYFKRIILTSCFLAFQFKASSSFKPTINVLTFMQTLDPTLVANFENENNLNVRVNFVGSRGEFETNLKSGLRAYDVVVADERILEKLYLSRLIRALPDENKIKSNKVQPLFKRSKINEDGSLCLPLFIDPMGVAFETTNSVINYPFGWNNLIETKNNPYWRQRIFFSPSYKRQFLIALLATQKEITPSSWFIPESTTKWFKELKLQNANTDLPLELAFLNNQISAAVIFYSDYLHLKKIVPKLDFIIPAQNTYFDRISVGWASNSPQEILAKKFIQYLYVHNDILAQKSGMLSLNTFDFKNSNTKNWVLYEDDIPLPKKIENILKDLAQLPTSAGL